MREQKSALSDAFTDQAITRGSQCHFVQFSDLETNWMPHFQVPLRGH
jgi:hypothetical protein